MDNHPQHFQAPAQRQPELPASARVATNVLTHTEAPVPSPSSSYVELFTQIAALQAEGDYYGLIQTAERADLAVCLPLCLSCELPLNLTCLSPLGSIR